MRAIGRKKKSPDIWPTESQSPKNRIVVLLDLENLTANLPPIGPETFSFSSGFDRVMKEIAREVGLIEDVFVFAPPHLIQTHGEHLYSQGFTIIACPKVTTKDGRQRIDTVDQTLIDFGKKIMRQTQGITHLCLGSGDKDFSLLIREAIRRGLKIIVVASSKDSLSKDLIELSDQVFLFSPIEQ